MPLLSRCSLAILLLAAPFWQVTNVHVNAPLVAASGCSATAVVNWLDTASYVKPCPVDINKPNEATATNKWWVDMSSGSGTTCSMASPCGSLDSVIGKAGTTGTGAIIYIKGTGNWSGFNDTLRGSGDADCRTATCDAWILIRTWPAGSTGCATECTATFTGNSNTNSSNIHHIMFDGGPDLKIRFSSDSGSSIYAFHAMSDYTIFYRVQVFCASSGDHTGFSVGDSNNAGDHTYFINNEGYGCLQASNVQASFVYLGPGSGTIGGADDLVIQNSLLREWGGEAIEINPRIAVTGVQITGNAIYDGGRISTFAGAHRPCVTISSNDTGIVNGVNVSNNIIWNCGSGCIWARASGSPVAMYYNNTCYDYINAGGGGDPETKGISGFTNACSGDTIRNNIIYDPEGFDPMCAAGEGSNNACASGKNCGTSKQTWTTANWSSISTASALYLMLASGSVAIGTGTTTGAPAVVGADYSGFTRGAAYDIGAFEFR